MSSSISAIFLDQSILPVALPTIARELAIDELGMQWIINAYLLTLTAFVLAGGRIGDMLGHRKIFSIGMLLFMFASITCAFAHSSQSFVLSRAAQGVGGALIIPTAATLLVSAFSEEERGRAYGIYASIGARLIGRPHDRGFLTQFLNWRYIFWINIPIVLTGLLLTFLFIPKSAKRKESFDYLGFFCTSVGALSIIIGLMQGELWGWTYWAVPTLIFLGLFLLMALIFFDRDVKDPFIDFSLFRDRGYVAANSCVFLTQFMLILTIFWAIYFQTVLGYSPSFAGLWAMIANSPLIFFSHVSGYLSDRFGPKLPTLIGFVSSGLGILWFVLMPTPSSPWLLIPMVILFGFGIPMIFLPCLTLSLSRVAPQKRGVAVGINITIRQFGATLGMAIFGQIFISTQGRFFASLLASDPATSALNPKAFEGLLANSKHAMQTFHTLSHDTAAKVSSDYLHSSIFGMQILNLCGIAAVIGGLACAFLLMRWGKYALKNHRLFFYEVERKRKFYRLSMLMK